MKHFIFAIFAGALACVSPPPARAQAPAGGPVPRVEWRDCPWAQAAPPEARCGDLVALQSRGRPDGPQVRVFFAIYRRTGTEAPLPDPVVIVPGGPGALFNPPVAYVMDGLAALRRRREVIIIDQRGVGRSTPRLACPAAPAGGAAPPRRRRGPFDCLARLVAGGTDPASFGTEETARDLGDLRRALKLDAWNPMGASYASRVVLRLAQIDPEGTRAAVVMAALPLAPSLARADIASRRRALLRRLFQDCAAEPACAAAYGDLAAKFAETQTLLEAAAERGAAPEPEEALGHVLRAERSTGGFASTLIERLDWPEDLPRLPRALSDLHAFLAGGKPLSEARIDEIYGIGAPSHLPPIDPTLIFVTTRCPEDILPASPAPGRSGWRDVCSFFAPAPVADTPPPKAPPLLILTGAYDVRTLTGWADEAAKSVPGAILARFGDTGHGVSYRHPCANALMNAFIADPHAPLDLGCVAQHARPNFEVPETAP